MASNLSGSKNPIKQCTAVDWSYTDVHRPQFDYLWIINTLSLRLSKGDEALKSSTFSDGRDEKKTFRLIMYSAANYPYHNNVCISLEFISSDTSSVKAMFCLSVLNGEGNTVATYKNYDPHDFGSRRTFDYKDIGRSAIFDSTGGLLHGDTLSILCKIDLLDTDVNVGGKSMISSIAATESLLCGDFKRLFENGKFSDVTLVVDEQEFRAHKAVLAARSPVFAAMFDCDMSETTSNRVVITDMDPDVLREMLRYMYTNNAPSAESSAKDLLVAADKYGLVQLMRTCEFILGRDISIETAADMFLLADSHNAKDLKAIAIEYINFNAAQVMDTDGWRNLVKSHSQLIADIYGALTTQMNNRIAIK